MGKHSEWRKLAKKARRKRIRRQNALIREAEAEKEPNRREQSPNYHKWLEEQKQAEEFQAQEAERLSKEANDKYWETERLAQIQWKALQAKLAVIREEKRKQNERIKMEWEAEQAKLRKQKEEKERAEEEKRLQQLKLQEDIDAFVNSNGEMPQELTETFHSNPGKAVCPFFSKMAACRFGDCCSRDHIRPVVSKILLIKNFYNHYSLNAVENEHGDNSLEYEIKDIVNDFHEFFNDVLPELEKFGNVRQFKTCCNREIHLRGNVYVEYADFREAIRSFRTFHGRFYGGKQLNVEFCKVESWRSAICGLFFRKQCPKGNNCNFLHVFRNPGNAFQDADRDLHRTPPKEDYERSERRNWRWSESPEVELDLTKSNGFSSQEKEHHRKSHKRRSHSPRSQRYKSKKRSKSRTRSSERRHKKRYR